MADPIRYRYVVAEDGTRSRHRVVVHRGFEGYSVRFTDACSGCFESGDYGGLAHQYGRDPNAGCYVGSGCDECGYAGKRRHVAWAPFPEIADVYLRSLSGKAVANG